MKVLSLLQPWATLVVIGAKKIETRSFSTNHRGPVLIHASKNMKPLHRQLTRTEPFWSKLKHLDELPLGCIVGKANIFEVSTTDFFQHCSKGIPLNDSKPYSEKEWEIELAFGDYSPGRYGWLLKAPVSFKHHIPFSGGVGFTKEFNDMICLSCGCTQDDCRVCIEKTGKPCSWITNELCSACAPKLKHAYRPPAPKAPKLTTFR